MEKYKKNIEEIIAAHFAGETSAEEEVFLSNWLKQEDNKDYFKSLQVIYDSAKRVDKQFNTDKAWNKLKQEIATPKGRVIPFINHSFYRIAAVITLLIGSIAWFTFQYFKEEPILVQANDKSREVILADQSTVVLNRNSSIRYDQSNARHITLQGEAYFKVVHKADDPFTVKTNGLTITDVGTAFNVKNTGADSVIIYVEEGEVFCKADNSSKDLVAGDRIVYTKSNHQFTKTAADINELSYKTKILVFENASLPVVVQKLYEVYGVQIKLNPSLEDCHLTATFRNESLQTILDIIAATLKLSIVKENKTIRLEGNGCGF